MSSQRNANMNEKLLSRAAELAAQPYQIHVFPDETTEGKPIYVAIVPDLPGCVTHGNTASEAKTALADVIVDFIYYMLEDGLEVPAPVPFTTDASIQIGDAVAGDESIKPQTLGLDRFSERAPRATAYRFSYEFV